MRGRRAGRIGIPLAPLVGKANGIFHLADVLLARKSTGWPVVTEQVQSGAIAASVRISPTPHVARLVEVKVNRGSLS